MGLSPDDVLRIYDEWMTEQMRDLVPPTAEQQARAARNEAKRLAEQGIRRQPGQPDREYRLGACPKCGGEVWGIKKCPHVSPPWRTFLACDNPDCSYHGRSRLTVEQLRRRWPEGVEGPLPAAAPPPPPAGEAHQGPLLDKGAPAKRVGE